MKLEKNLIILIKWQVIVYRNKYLTYKEWKAKDINTVSKLYGH